MENLVIACMFISSLIAAINIAFLIDIHKKVEQARINAYNAYSNASDAENKAALACYRLDNIYNKLDTLVIRSDAELREDAQRKREFANMNVNKIVTTVKSIFSCANPNRYTYANDSDGFSSWHKFTYKYWMISDSVLSDVREVLNRSTVMWREEHNPQNGEWITYIYNAE